MRYLEFLSRVHELVQPSSYLEIGVHSGKSLALSRVTSIGIDPEDNLVGELGEHVTFCETTSDEFFARENPLAPFEEPAIDLAFIDGLHLYEYVLRDFMNVERHARWGSVIVLDDILPRNPVEALRDRETDAWTGDVWKIIPTLAALRPDLFCLQVATKPTGLLLVLGADAENTTLQQHYDQLLERYTKPDPPPPENILRRVGAIDPETVLAAPFWKVLRDQRNRGIQRAEGLPQLTRTMRDWAAACLSAEQAKATSPTLARRKQANLTSLVRRLPGRQAAKLPQRARPVLRRGVQKAERSVAAAFLAVVERQSGRGELSGPVERAIAEALRHVQMTSLGRPRLTSPAVREVVDRFHTLWYEDRNTWRRNTWQGHMTWKCPLDLWLYQEVIHAVQPGLVIETGTFFGGSATYLGWVLDTQGRGRVVSVDIDPRATPPHPRVSYITGSSTDPAIVAEIKSHITVDEPVMVILDSDHSEQHVYAELQAYADLVTPGSYLIVEDTNINGHPTNLRHGPGPMEAAQRFLSERTDFVVDEDMHRLHLTLNPKGYLRRII